MLTPWTFCHSIIPRCSCPLTPAFLVVFNTLLQPTDAQRNYILDNLPSSFFPLQPHPSIRFKRIWTVLFQQSLLGGERSSILTFLCLKAPYNANSEWVAGSENGCHVWWAQWDEPIVKVTNIFFFFHCYFLFRSSVSPLNYAERLIKSALITVSKQSMFRHNLLC